MEENTVKYYFYALIDPIENVPKYIGRTIDPKGRFRNHRYEAKKGNKTKRELWFNSLLKKGLEPKMKILHEEVCTIEKARQIELEYIEATSEVYPLKNGEDHALGRVLHGKKVYQYDMQGGFIKEYPNANQARLFTGVSDAAIGSCCRSEEQGLIQKAHDYFWSYTYYPVFPFVTQYLNHKKERNAKKVFQYDLNHNLLAEFVSVHEAERQTGISFKKISQCCIKKQICMGLYTWEYSNTDNN